MNKTTDAHKAAKTALALITWVDSFDNVPACGVLRDAILQATKAETIEWLAAIAERYGFKP